MRHIAYMFTVSAHQQAGRVHLEEPGLISFNHVLHF